MSNVPLKDLKYSRFYVRSVYCSWKKIFRLSEHPENYTLRDFERIIPICDPASQS